MQDEYKGYSGTIILTDTGVIIKRGAKGFLLGGGMLRGDKTIPYSSIVAVQLKKAGMTAGYLQLTLQGGSEAKSGLMQSTTDENTVNFHSRKNKDFIEAKQRIEEKISQVSGQPQQASSDADELEKLASLKEKGIITQAEFEAKKKQILGT
jgi:hypothetical protein